MVSAFTILKTNLQFGGFDDEDNFPHAGFMGGFPGLQGMTSRVNRPFNEDYRCYSMAMFPGAQRENVDYGGKGIISFIL